MHNCSTVITMKIPANFTISTTGINWFDQQENVPELPADVQHFDVVNLNLNSKHYTKIVSVN